MFDGTKKEISNKPLLCVGTSLSISGGEGRGEVYPDTINTGIFS